MKYRVVISENLRHDLFQIRIHGLEAADEIEFGERDQQTVHLRRPIRAAFGLRRVLRRCEIGDIPVHEQFAGIEIDGYMAGAAVVISSSRRDH